MAGQFIFGSSSGNAASATSITVSATYTSGDRILVWVKYYDGGAGISATITDGTHSFALVDTAYAIESGGRVAGLYEAINVTGGSYTITASFKNGSNTPTAVVDRAVAYWRGTGLDTNPGQDGIGNIQDPAAATANAVTSGNVTPTAQPNIVFGVTISKANAASISVGTGFTTLGNIPAYDAIAGDTSLAEYKRTTSTSATAATFTLGGTDSMLTIGAVFGEGASGPSAAVLSAAHRRRRRLS